MFFEAGQKITSGSVNVNWARFSETLIFELSLKDLVGVSW